MLQFGFETRFGVRFGLYCELGKPTCKLVVIVILDEIHSF